MKKLVFAAFAASLTLPLSATQAQNPDIVVSSSRSIEKFVEDISQDLSENLEWSNPLRSDLQGTGVAQVLFQCGADGKPVNITMYRKAGSQKVNWLAKRAVSRIDVLHPLPNGVSEDQLYLANIIIADSPVQYAQLSRKLNKREAQRLASPNGRGNILAFTSGKSPST